MACFLPELEYSHVKEVKHYLYAKFGHNSIRDNKVIHVFVFFKLLRYDPSP